MHDADFEYWRNKSIEELEEADSVEVMVDRLQKFRSENIEAEYSDLAVESIKLDPEGNFSSTGGPVIKFSIGDSPLIESVYEDESSLRCNPDGAVLHAYNVGRGIRKGVDEVVAGLADLGMDEVCMEVLDGSQVSSYEGRFGLNVLVDIGEQLQAKNTDASMNMATGLFAAYSEDEYLDE